MMLGDLSGILILNKPPGMTSHDCVALVRRLARVKKAGHTGTLDPEATGVLPICLGQATKITPFLLEASKAYLAQFQLGVATTTEDFTGEVVEKKPVLSPPAENRIKEVLTRFIGEIVQIPPMYSAVKVKGKKLYEWAREGIEVERPVRRVRIDQLELIEYVPHPPFPTITIKVACSKGTYIRTLCVDIGRSLGFPAHLTSLVRTKSGPFTLEDSVTVDVIEAWTPQDWQEKILPIDTALRHFPSIRLDEKGAEKIRHGQKILLKTKERKASLYRIYGPDRKLIALGRMNEYHWLKPEKVFH